MTQAELINRLAANLRCSKKQAKEIIDGTFSTIADELSSGGSVALQGFGTFKVVERPEGYRRNPGNGESVFSPAKKVVKFKASGKLLVNP